MTIMSRINFTVSGRSFPEAKEKSSSLQTINNPTRTARAGATVVCH